jgi:predicted metalloprotease
MRWQGRRESSNVEDRRRSATPVAVGGGIGVIVIAIIIGLLGGDPQQFLQQANQGGGVQVGIPAGGVGGGEAPLSEAEEQRGRFAKVVLADTEDVWNRIFAAQGRKYREPTLVLFSGQVSSACGNAESASGPFYCPADSKLYLDTTFFIQLDEQLGARGDFACAYVIAHEVGHHIQNLLGTTDQMERARRTVSQVEYNDLSVRLELQADFLAGVCLHHVDRMKDIIEPGDIEDAFRAAAAIGDDTLQKRSGRVARPETFTHGTSKQRLKWFKLGLETGDISLGDTFSVKNL